MVHPERISRKSMIFRILARSFRVTQNNGLRREISSNNLKNEVEAFEDRVVQIWPQKKCPEIDSRINFCCTCCTCCSSRINWKNQIFQIQLCALRNLQHGPQIFQLPHSLPKHKVVALDSSMFCCLSGLSLTSLIATTHSCLICN